MTLKLGQYLKQKTKMSFRFEDEVATAARYWMEKDHHSFAIPVSILARILAGKSGNPKMSTGGGLTQYGGLVEAEVVFLSPEEIAVLDPDEKVGLLIGDCIFIADSTPGEYWHLVALHLEMLSMLKDDNPVARLLREAGISIETERHWTANILDIMLAEQDFANPERLQGYLRWRKSIERTDFFRDPTVDDILAQKLKSLGWRRTTHPAQRGRHTEKSWKASGLLASLGTDFADEGKSLAGVSNADTIYRKLQQDPQFEPNDMLRLLEILRNVFSDKKNRVPVKNHLKWAVTVPFELEPAAYLLCEDIQGPLALLFPVNGKERRYILGRQISTTLHALKDRVAYFAIAALQKQGLTSEMLILLQGAARAITATSLEGGKGSLQADEAASQLVEDIARLDEQIRKIKELEDRLNPTDADEITPTVLQERKMQMLKIREVLVAEQERLKREADVARTAVETLQASDAVLRAIVVDAEEVGEE